MSTQNAAIAAQVRRPGGLQHAFSRDVSVSSSFISLDRKVRGFDAVTTQLSQQATKDVIKKAHETNGEPIKGPMILEMVGNYFFTVVFWLSRIKQTGLLISFGVVQITRIAHSKNDSANIQFYLSLIPFACYIFISREAHLIAFLLWYITFMLIYLQSGLPEWKRILQYTDFYQNEIMISLAAIALTGNIILLYNTNVELRKQLRKENRMNILHDVKEETSDKLMVKELDRIMKVLHSDQLYTPDYVGEWLKGMMQTAKTDLYVAPKPTVQHYPISLQETRVFELLKNIDDSNFDVATVETESDGRVLFYVGYYLFAKHDLLSRHKIPEATFRNWLMRIEAGYRGNNPYHNAIHAADVAHSMNYYITRTRIWPNITPEEQLASFIAAIIHDFMHPGVNNAFLVNSTDPLAIRYNDTSVLENFHCATTIVSAVLATDIAMHFDWIGKFKNKMGVSGGGINFEVKLDRRLLINMAIKCADVNNPSKPLVSCKRGRIRLWKTGMQVSMFMNRLNTDIPKCQIGFIDFIVFPLFDVWALFMQEDLSTQMQNIALNKQYWKDQTIVQPQT
ncbi:HD-domain/PDEase-like protein [Rhizoclosmatium globosum]|uniref:Phosphodiesterase n=1 Tax=Rhizoclosmatium globosum TaxID=329046 RepID=A0A1Y2D3G3_9FUNG|nr:HD-domain/PDEase-like protein [Rhizoclosmatium globosum]|eukprot:ORY53833.1 HD-domain/PDEase-like protein [Rhizoclosmatium globosum]